MTVNGVSGNIRQLSQHFGIRPATAANRLRLGWTVDDAFLKPVRVQGSTSAVEIPPQKQKKKMSENAFGFQFTPTPLPITAVVNYDIARAWGRN